MIFMGIAGAATLSGTVRDVDGEPLAGLSVYAYDERLAYGVASTDTAGSWSMVLPGGRFRVRVLPQSNHVERFYPDAWDYCDAAVIRVDDDDTVQGLDLVLGDGGTLSGVLLDSSGDPVEGALVECEGVDQRSGFVDRSAFSDSLGAFRCVGLDSDSNGSGYSVAADVEGWPDQYLGGVYRNEDGPEAIKVTVAEDTDIGEFVLMDGIRVAGTVDGYDGPVAQANVHVYSYGQVADLLSEDDGSYLAQDLPPGDIVAWASLEGYGLTYHPDSDLPTTEVSAEEGEQVEGVDIFMPEEARVTGRVIGEGDLSGVTLLAYNDNYTVGLGAPVAADGSFSARRLREGTWHLYFYAAAEGYLDDFARDEQEQRLSFELSGPGDVVEVDVQLRLGAQLKGVVRDDAGDPVYGASVRASHENGTEYRARSVRTERDGSYQLVGLAPGRHILDVSYTAYCSADPDYVPWYVPDTPHELAAEYLELEGGEILELDWEIPVDSDHDGMSDAWEREQGLDVGRDDSDEDPDEDGLSNLEEYWLGLNPFDSDQAPRCGGCNSTVGGLWLLPLVLLRRRRD